MEISVVELGGRAGQVPRGEKCTILLAAATPEFGAHQESCILEAADLRMTYGFDISVSNATGASRSRGWVWHGGADLVTLNLESM